MHRFKFESTGPTFAKLWLDDVEVCCERVEFTAGVDQLHKVNFYGVHVGDGVAIDAEATAEAQPQPVAFTQNFTVNVPDGKVSAATARQIREATARGMRAAGMLAVAENEGWVQPRVPGKSMDFFEWRRDGWPD